MESPLEILSLAAQIVDSGMRSMKRSRPSSGNCNYLRQQKRNSAPQLPTPNLQLDEPLDMSLKSRKRAASGDFYPTNTKKYRPSVIAFVPNAKEEQRIYIHSEPKQQYQHARRVIADKNIKLSNKASGANAGKTKSNISKTVPIAPKGTHHAGIGKNKNRVSNIPSPSLIITPDYNEAGIEEHFRKSLKKYTNDDKEHESNDQENIEKWNAEVSVESHFIRSLGYDQWIRIKQQYKLKKDKETAAREQLAAI